MFIQTEQTPNPATLKFLPGKEVLGAGNTADFPNAEAAADRSPLAEALFGIPGVTGVFLGDEFISVSKTEEEEWFTLKPSILGIVMQHFTAGKPVMYSNAGDDDGVEGDGTKYDAEDAVIVKQIQELLNTRVRPAVAQDGGDIVFHGFEKGIVYLAMRGACAGCPSATATLKMGIENMLRHYIPEVQEVRAA